MANRRISLKGKGADLFFGEYGPDVSEVSLPSEQLEQEAPVEEIEIVSVPSPEPAIAPLSNGASTPARTRASTQASKHASASREEPNVVESIRKVVKRPGKEVVYVRLTPEEKGQLADVVYTYKRQGIRTSDNELGRIAINGLLADYQEHGDQSLLAKVLAALEA
jgi:hypothetical protein